MPSLPGIPYLMIVYILCCHVVGEAGQWVGCRGAKRGGIGTRGAPSGFAPYNPYGTASIWV